MSAGSTIRAVALAITALALFAMSSTEVVPPAAAQGTFKLDNCSPQHVEFCRSLSEARNAESTCQTATSAWTLEQHYQNYPRCARVLVTYIELQKKSKPPLDDVVFAYHQVVLRTVAGNETLFAIKLHEAAKERREIIE